MCLEPKIGYGLIGGNWWKFDVFIDVFSGKKAVKFGGAKLS
jgi:hypothetical protein